MEKLARRENAPEANGIAPRPPVSFRTSDPTSIVNAMAEYQAMLDATRTGLIKKQRAAIPTAPLERANHLKSFGYYCDADMVGMCEIPNSAHLEQSVVNPDVARLARTLATKQTKTLASGIDVIMAGLRESLQAPPTSCTGHTHAIVFLYAYQRDFRTNEAGTGWIRGAHAQRACLRASETAVTLANYIRLLGWDARAHSEAASDVNLVQLAVAAGLAVGDGDVSNPFAGARFGLSVVTTTLEMAPDKPLHNKQKHDVAWTLGAGAQAKSKRNADPYARRDYKDGAHPFERLKRTDDPTTYIDEANVARVPKRTNMFARALFGDMGKKLQDAARNGNYVRKSAAAFAFRPSLGALTLLQDGDPAPDIHPDTADAHTNADNIKATCYFLGCDAVGISRCPDWVYYSHNAAGEKITPYHDNAISIIIDQGHETMEGASGDDWIACAQSMRAYLRFSLLGGVIAQQIRNLGYSARVHSVMDDEVLQPPLLLLAGLGEVSRIGEVILNPYLGPRLKSGVITTSMPLSFDKPIDFGLQNFCDTCNKCARECPSGAITAGPKLMFNGYEIWKSDSQKCTSYRLTTAGGAMCGRCMKTCPWNLEGLFAEAPFRWAAMTFPRAARGLAKLDDMLGNGDVNEVKRWWWDLEMIDEGPYDPSPHQTNHRGLSKDLDLKYADQTLAVYPANLAPPPHAWPSHMDREAGIRAYHDMIPAGEHRTRRRAGLPTEHRYTADRNEAPVMQVVVSKVEAMTDDVIKYEFAMPDGSAMPAVQAGAHIDVVVAPEFFRQYSLSGDPADRNLYQIAVLREPDGRGGSSLMHRIFEEGRRVFISKPLNHFELVESAAKTFLMGGGIGVTPMIAMAHRLHALGADFALHLSCSQARRAPFIDDLKSVAWAENVVTHMSDQGTRADLGTILQYQKNAHVYVCGPDAYMQAVLDTAEQAGFPEINRHVEYFSTPEVPEYENHAFTVTLARSGTSVPVAADQSAAEAIVAAGVHVDIKCNDGLCGVCKCGLVSGQVEHRDFVLSKSQRETNVILCQSRAARAGGVISVDL